MRAEEHPNYTTQKRSKCNAAHARETAAGAHLAVGRVHGLRPVLEVGLGGCTELEA